MRLDTDRRFVDSERNLGRKNSVFKESIKT